MILESRGSRAFTRQKEIRTLAAQPHQQKPISETESLRSSLAWACTVYSLVPYLGILFIPFTVVFSGVERARADANRRALIPLALSVPILAGQLTLWWLLYLIPEIGI